MQMVIYIFLIFFSVVGICDIIHSIHIRLILPRKCFKKIMICQLDNKDYATQLNYLLEQYKWYGTKCFDKFICLCETDIPKIDNFEFKDEFCFINCKDTEKLYEELGEEYGLSFRQHRA